VAASTVEAAVVGLTAAVAAVASTAAAVVADSIAAAVMIADVDVTTGGVTVVGIEAATVVETGGVTVAEIEAATAVAGVPVATIVAGDINFYCITLYTGYRRCAGS